VSRQELVPVGRNFVKPRRILVLIIECFILSVKGKVIPVTSREGP
jgi:hypothetical protein